MMVLRKVLFGFTYRLNIRPVAVVMWLSQPVLFIVAYRAESVILFFYPFHLTPFLDNMASTSGRRPSIPVVIQVNNGVTRCHSVSWFPWRLADDKLSA